MRIILNRCYFRIIESRQVKNGCNKASHRRLADASFDHSGYDGNSFQGKYWKITTICLIWPYKFIILYSVEAPYIEIVFFLQFKRAPFLDYIDVAALHGINNVNKKDMSSSFKQAIKSMSKDYPHFGATSNLTSEEWWFRVIQDTFKGKLCT